MASCWPLAIDDLTTDNWTLNTCFCLCPQVPRYKFSSHRLTTSPKQKGFWCLESLSHLHPQPLQLLDPALNKRISPNPLKSSGVLLATHAIFTHSVIVLTFTNKGLLEHRSVPRPSVLHYSTGDLGFGLNRSSTLLRNRPSLHPKLCHPLSNSKRPQAFLVTITFLVHFNCPSLRVRAHSVEHRRSTQAIPTHPACSFHITIDILKMPIRNPFTRRQADDGALRPSLNVEPGHQKTTPGFERIDTVGSKASSSISISSRQSQDKGEYKMSGTHDKPTQSRIRSMHGSSWSSPCIEGDYCATWMRSHGLTIYSSSGQ